MITWTAFLVNLLILGCWAVAVFSVHFESQEPLTFRRGLIAIALLLPPTVTLMALWASPLRPKMYKSKFTNAFSNVFTGLRSFLPYGSAVAVVSTAVMFIVVTAEQQTQQPLDLQNPNIAWHIADELHPQCLHRLIVEEGDSVPMNLTECQAEFASLDVKSSIFESLWDDRKLPRRYSSGESGSFYFEVADASPSEGAEVMVVVNSNRQFGESQIRGAISLLRIEQVRNKLYSELLTSIDLGNQCHDGFPQYMASTSEKVIYATAATPWRLLNPTNSVTWYMFAMFDDEYSTTQFSHNLFGEWLPDEDVANGIDQCDGYVIRSLNFQTGQTDVIGVMVEPTIWSSKDSAKQARCLQTVKLEPDQKKSWEDSQLLSYSIEDWNNKLAEFERACVGLEI